MTLHKIKIMVADDHPLVLSGLLHLLGNCNDMTVTGSYTNGNDLLMGLAANIPDVLLLDIQMPGKNGEEVANQVQEQYPMVKMIALTNFDDVYYIKSMIARGVLGYILKTTREEILLNAIRMVYTGKQYLEPALMDKLAAELKQEKMNAHLMPVLSRREKEVLQFIAQNLTSQEIADKMYLSKRTIDTHRLNLMLKLEVKNVAALVKKAIEVGLLR